MLLGLGRAARAYLEVPDGHGSVDAGGAELLAVTLVHLVNRHLATGRKIDNRDCFSMGGEERMKAESLQYASTPDKNVLGVFAAQDGLSNRFFTLLNTAEYDSECKCASDLLLRTVHHSPLFRFSLMTTIL